MSKAWRLGFAATISAGVLLWSRASTVNGSFFSVLGYGIAGMISGFLLFYIAREFASLRFDRKLALESVAFGFLVFTPLIAMLLGNSTDATSSSIVVIAVASAGTAALAGSVWGVVKLADEAFSEWRHDRQLPATPR